MFRRISISAVTLSALMFTMLCLFPSVGTAQTPGELQQQKDPPPAKKSRSNIYPHRQGFNPCDELNKGGTIYDPTQCDELATNGMTFLRNKTGKGSTLVMLAGKKAEWQLTSKNKNARFEGTKVLLRRKADHSIVANSIANLAGKFTLTIPADLEGDVELVTEQHSMKQGNGNGDNEGFCFEYLPRDWHVVMCEIHVEDVPLDICLRVVKGRSTRP